MSTTTRHQTVLLIGASRGLGLAIAKEYLARGAHVVATVRGRQHTALHDTQTTFADQLEIEDIDIAVADQINGLHRRLNGRRFDLLFVNAGVTNEPQETAADVSTEQFTRLMITRPVRCVSSRRSEAAPPGCDAPRHSSAEELQPESGRRRDRRLTPRTDRVDDLRSRLVRRGQKLGPVLRG